MLIFIVLLFLATALSRWNFELLDLGLCPSQNIYCLWLEIPPTPY